MISPTIAPVVLCGCSCHAPTVAPTVVFVPLLRIEAADQLERRRWLNDGRAS